MKILLSGLAASLAMMIAVGAQAQDADSRAADLVKQMTQAEKLQLVFGYYATPSPKKGYAPPAEVIPYSAGFVPGIKRLNIPNQWETDAGLGVASHRTMPQPRLRTALPSGLATAATWNPELAYAGGAMIGHEARMSGFNVMLSGGANLLREPRNGRNFEYAGEDPLLAGTMVGSRVRCEGAQHVISDIKHYALNDQESGRVVVDSRIGERAARESDLLAFELGVKTGQPKAVMCSYNGINGTYACENRWLLTDVLKREWNFPGFVVSDWEATHSVEKASAAGLDQEQPYNRFYGEKLKEAVEAGLVSRAELDEHVRRILWAEFASGVFDDPARKGVVDAQKGFDVARRIEEQSAVLLRNRENILPLDRAQLHSVAIIGLHADTGMISGGGSAQVDAPGQLAGAEWRAKIWFPTSPLEAIRAKAPQARVSFCSGENIAEAVAQAKQAEVAVVFAWQWEAEDADLPNLSLPDGQDKLIAAVTAANPRTIVVLETGSIVTMPWIDRSAAVLEAWFGGVKGADAVANLLFGDVNPSGKLPISIPVSEDELPRTRVAKPPKPVINGQLSFQVDYSEGPAVGYKWYQSQHRPMLFPFGFGLSYTTFRYSGLSVSADGSQATFTLANTGHRKGAEVAQVYAELPAAAGEPWKRLVGWQKVELDAGETRTLHVKVEPLAMSVWDQAAKKWTRPAGTYRVSAGASSADAALTATFTRR